MLVLFNDRVLIFEFLLSLAIVMSGKVFVLVTTFFPGICNSDQIVSEVQFDLSSVKHEWDAYIGSHQIIKFLNSFINFCYTYVIQLCTWSIFEVKSLDPPDFLD